MPTLLLFAACGKVIVSELDHTTSLITLLEAIDVAIPEGDEEKISPSITVATSWSLIAVWQQEPGDLQKRFEHRYAIATASGEEVPIPEILPLKFEPDKPNYRSVVIVRGFPAKILLAGDHCVFRLFMREVGENGWQMLREYPILIRRQPLGQK